MRTLDELAWMRKTLADANLQVDGLGFDSEGRISDDAGPLFTPNKSMRRSQAQLLAQVFVGSVNHAPALLDAYAELVKLSKAVVASDGIGAQDHAVVALRDFLSTHEGES